MEHAFVTVRVIVRGLRPSPGSPEPRSVVSANTAGVPRMKTVKYPTKGLVFDLYVRDMRLEDRKTVGRRLSRFGNRFSWFDLQQGGWDVWHMDTFLVQRNGRVEEWSQA